MNYEIATYVEDKELQFDSLVGFVKNYGNSKSDDYLDVLRAFEILVKSKRVEDQILIADNFLSNINFKSFKYSLDIVERAYFSGLIEPAKSSLLSLENSNWVKDNASDDLLKFKERVGAFSEVNPKAIGVICHCQESTKNLE